MQIKLSWIRHILKYFLFVIFIIVIGCNQTNDKNQKSEYISSKIDSIPLVPIIDDRPENFVPDTGTMTNDGLVYYSYDEAPKFGKTDSAFNYYLKNNINYPDSDKFEKVKGTVYLSFVVLKNGKVSQIKIIRGVRDDIDQECLRVFKNMPKWKPGKKNGETVNIKLIKPIVFSTDK